MVIGGDAHKYQGEAGCDSIPAENLRRTPTFSDPNAKNSAKVKRVPAACGSTDIKAWDAWRAMTSIFAALAFNLPGLRTAEVILRMTRG